MFYFNKNMFKSGYILLTFAIILIPLSFILPIECSYENHLLENLEIIILFTGIILSIYKIVHTSKFNNFYISCSIFYFVMILRELSWGRVFYPIGLKNNGEKIYMSIHDIWYGPIVYPLITLLIILAIILLIKCYVYCHHKNIIWHIPINYLIIFAALMIISQSIFEKELITAFIQYNQTLEETTEILAYVSLVCFTYNWKFKNFYLRSDFNVKFL